MGFEMRLKSLMVLMIAILVLSKQSRYFLQEVALLGNRSVHVAWARPAGHDGILTSLLCGCEKQSTIGVF